MYYSIFKSITMYYSLLQYLTGYNIVLQSNILHNALYSVL